MRSSGARWCGSPGPAQVMQGKGECIGKSFNSILKGIGAALAIECAKEDAKIVISARRENLLEKTKEKCIEAGAKCENIFVLPMDMCDFSSHQKCFKAVLDNFGKLDILINNAGRSQRGRWEHINIDVDIELFNLNVFSVINLTRYSLHVSSCL